MSIPPDRRQALTLLAGLALAGSGGKALAAKLPKVVAPPATPLVAMVGQIAAGGFYEACRDGAQEALSAIGGIELTFGAPIAADAKEQIQLVTDLIKQKISALVISPVNAEALAPICRRALARGVKVISFERPLPRDSRLLNLDAASIAGKAQTLLTMMAKALDSGGEVGIVAGDGRDVEEKQLVNAIIREWVKPDYARLKLAATGYGNDDDAKAYAAAGSLIDDHPGLRGIIAGHPVALAAAARAVADKGMTGKVFATGFGQPSQLQASIAAGTIVSFAIANPTDLGYAAARIAAALINKQVTAKSGETLDGGRLGPVVIGDAGSVVLGPPFVVDKGNIEAFAKVF